MSGGNAVAFDTNYATMIGIAMETGDVAPEVTYQENQSCIVETPRIATNQDHLPNTSLDLSIYPSLDLSQNNMKMAKETIIFLPAHPLKNELAIPRTCNKNIDYTQTRLEHRKPKNNIEQRIEIKRYLISSASNLPKKQVLWNHKSSVHKIELMRNKVILSQDMYMYNFKFYLTFVYVVLWTVGYRLLVAAQSICNLEFRMTSNLYVK